MAKSMLKRIAAMVLLLSAAQIAPAKTLQELQSEGYVGFFMTRRCQGDDLVYTLYYFSPDHSYVGQDFTLAGQCKCKSGSAIEGPRPHAATCLLSTNLTGGMQSNANNQAPVSGSATGPSGSAREGHAAAPTGATAFTPTLPFRAFALPNYFSGSSPPTPSQASCNAALKPTVFQVFHADGVVQRASLCDGTILATIPVTSNPLQVQVTPDGKWGIVTSYDNAISFINTDTNHVDNVIHTDPDTFPSGVSISPDGSFALVTNYINDHPALLVIDVQKQTIANTFPLALSYPQSVFLSPDGTLAWVTFPFGNAVEVVDVITGDIVKSIQVPEPIDVVFNAAGTMAFISSASPGSVLAVDTKTYSVIQNITTARGSSDLKLSPDGGLLVVNNLDDSSVSLINTATFKVSTTPVSGAPIGITLAPVQ